jgi:glycosyltransferase involved in cell wall biosynthesis
MRVLHYYPRAAAGDGGISQSLRALSRSLVELGVEVTMVHDEPGPYRDPDDGIDWVRLRHVGPTRSRVPVGLADHARRADVVTVHSAWTANNARAAAVARAVDVPYVIAPRGAYDPSIRARRPLVRRAWWLAVERQVVAGARAAHVFFPGQESHVRELGFDGPLIVAPNGVRIPPGVRWDGGSGGYVLFLGRYDPQHKGLDLLVRGMGLLPPDQRPTLRLHGSDWQGGKATVEALVADLGLEPWVEVGGHLSGDAKFRALAAARGLVYPSRWEAFGNSVAEAAAAGVPILATPYPLARHLADRDAAVLAPPTPEGLAEGLRTLLATPGEDLGGRAAGVARDELTWTAVATRWRDQLLEVV